MVYIIILIKLTFFLDLIIINRKFFLYKLYLHPFYLPNKRPILSINKTKEETLKKGRQFLDKCLKFQSNYRYKYIKQPKATVIIPLYNCEETIKPAIHSIQYQNLTQLEIILINDYSKDNTYNIIKNIQKYDQRIKIINNNRNMGALYSRSIAALMSKGEYVF